MGYSVTRWTQLLVVGLIISAFSSTAIAETTVSIKAPSLGLDRERAQVLVLGTFHFQDPGLDDYQSQNVLTSSVRSAGRGSGSW